ncbi:MAG TPA: sigma-70 family RNA polymerase sigma factor [Myxococcota bacterium]|nr:sigma-70 family RNA polymerase sigma factor [Myxococcota bacterium]
MSASTIELNESTQSAVSKKNNKSRRALSGRVSGTQELTTPSPNSIPQDVETARAVERACTDLQWLVMREARRVARRVPYFTEIDDLIGAGSLGLVTAVQRHIDRPAPILQRFAQLRIRGAILDHLRMNDHLTRRQRAAVGQLRKQTEKLNREGQTVDTDSLAQAMGMGRARVERIQHQLAAVHVTHIEDGERLQGEDDPSSSTMKNELQQHVMAALATLPEKMQTLLSLYYYESLSYREIGTVLGVTDSRVCQLHTQAMQTLRRRLAHLR